MYKISLDKIGKAYETAFKTLYANQKNQIQIPWFKNEESAEEWAGDIAFDLICETLEALGYEIIY